jgi:hypothetical protein
MERRMQLKMIFVLFLGLACNMFGNYVVQKFLEVRSVFLLEGNVS